MKHLHDLSDEELAGVLERGLGALSPEDGAVDMESFDVLQTARHARGLIADEEQKPLATHRHAPADAIFADCCSEFNMMDKCAPCEPMSEESAPCAQQHPDPRPRAQFSRCMYRFENLFRSVKDDKDDEDDEDDDEI